MVLRFFLLACVFILLSCSEAEFNNPYDPDSPNYIGNQRSISSEAGVPVQTSIIYGKSVDYQGETYQTVLIGNQTWFKRNLNYYVEGSKCYNDSIANCDKYGRLYDWATAMGIDAKYNDDYWDIDETKVNEKHKGICPNGWHIPSDADWDALINAGGGSSTAGTKLKATREWINDIGKPEGNGDDAFGFSALPGGISYSSGSFSSVGISGYWWTATEINASNAYTRCMHFNSAYVYYDSNVKSRLFSVRCVKD